MTSKFNTQEIMKSAWLGYRKMARAMRDTKFNRARFNYELRLAWLQAKGRLPVPPPKAAPVVVRLPEVRARIAEIRAGLFDLEMGDRIDWPRHDALCAELSRIAA